MSDKSDTFECPDPGPRLPTDDTESESPTTVSVDIEDSTLHQDLSPNARDTVADSHDRPGMSDQEAKMAAELHRIAAVVFEEVSEDSIVADDDSTLTLTLQVP